MYTCTYMYTNLHVHVRVGNIYMYMFGVFGGFITPALPVSVVMSGGGLALFYCPC